MQLGSFRLKTLFFHSYTSEIVTIKGTDENPFEFEDKTSRRNVCESYRNESRYSCEFNGENNSTPDKNLKFDKFERKWEVLLGECWIKYHVKMTLGECTGIYSFWSMHAHQDRPRLIISLPSCFTPFIRPKTFVMPHWTSVKSCRLFVMNMPFCYRQGMSCECLPYMILYLQAPLFALEYPTCGCAQQGHSNCTGHWQDWKWHRDASYFHVPSLFKSLTALALPRTHQINNKVWPFQVQGLGWYNLNPCHVYTSHACRYTYQPNFKSSSWDGETPSLPNLQEGITIKCMML